MTLDLKHACLVALVALVAVADAAAQTPSDQKPATLQVNIQSIQIHRVPPSPAGGYWDGSIIGNLFLGGVTGIYPDIEICLRRGTLRQCRRVCVNAQLYEPEEAVDPNIKPTECKLEVEGNLAIARLTEVKGQEPLREPFDLEVVVNEFDSTLNAEPIRNMGGFSFLTDSGPLLREPEKCTRSQPCRISIVTKNGTFVASFATNLSGVVGRLPPPSLRGAPSNTPGTAPVRPLTPDDIESHLADLRDADNCQGPDQFVTVPLGTTMWKSLRQFLWGRTEADNYYALASLVAAIPDPQTQARVDALVRRRVQDRGNENLYADVVRDLKTAQSMDATARMISESIAGRLIRMGIGRYLPTVSRPGSLAADIETWMLKQLASDTLANEAVDLMFNDRNLTAECVLNELAKRGFQEAVAGY